MMSIVVHTYPDGSQRHGQPPFPKLSPKEEAAGKKEPEAEEVKQPAKKAASKKAD